MTTIPSVALLLLRPASGGPELACVHRAGGTRFDADVWGLPGGPRAPEEPLEAAARRWAQQQLGFAPDACEPAGCWREAEFRPDQRVVEVLQARAAQAPALVSADGGLQAVAWWTPAALLARWEADQAPLEPLLRRVLQALEANQAPPEALGDGALETTGPEPFPGLRVWPLRTPTLLPATHTNCVVVGRGEAVVIDPASPYDDEQAALNAALERLAAAGTRVRELVLTHHHPDHVGGVAALAERLGVGVAAHPTTRALLADRGVAVTRAIADGERLELPGPPARRLRAILCEGHADGHLAFFEETTGVLIAGDMVAGTGTIVIDPPEGKLGLYLRSLEALRQLGARFLVPSHGPVIGDPDDLIAHYVRHRGWREAKVQAALAEHGPAGVKALVPHVYDDVPPHLYPLAARSLLAHLLKLEEDGAARRREDVWQAS